MLGLYKIEICGVMPRKKQFPTQGSSVMDALRNRFDENDLENAPSLFDKPANPAPPAPPAASVASAGAGPAVVCARPQFRRLAEDEPNIPVKLVC